MRGPCGRAAVQADVLRDVASTRTIHISVGPAATGEDVVRLLDDAVRVRRTCPLVLVTDNGAAYRSQAVQAWCTANAVLHLFSLPHTPQHNAASEHGMRELEAEAALGKGVRVHDIDGRRLRSTRGWKAAVQADQDAAPWSSLLTRAEIYSAATCAIREAMLHCSSARARRRAAREAILGMLQRLGRGRDGPARRNWRPFPRSRGAGMPRRLNIHHA